MSLNVVEGLMGAGKSYVGTNWLILDELRQTKRHVYTTLPIKPKAIARKLFPRNVAKQQDVIDRLHILEDKEKQVYQDGKPVWKTLPQVPQTIAELAMVPDAMGKLGWKNGYEPSVDGDGFVFCDDSGRPILKNPPLAADVGVPLVLNEAKFFWRFTRPNSLIVVDEAADLWDARNWKKTHEEGAEFAGEFGVYIRQHRHYKDDFWVICHNLADIDSHLRRKFHFIWKISNSRAENMFDSPWWRGLRWPVQFFFVRQYTVQDLKKPMEEHRVFPNKDGYSLYDSFSAASRLPGKALPDSEARSEDFKPSIWKRVKEVLRAVRKIAFLVGLFGVGGAVVFFKVIAPMVGYGSEQFQKKVNSVTGPMSPPTHAAAPAVPGETTETKPASGSPAEKPAGDKEAQPPAPPKIERVTAVFRSPRFVALSDGRKFVLGNIYENRKLLRIDADGLYFAGGYFIAAPGR